MESEWAGTPARVIRERYRRAADIAKVRGKCAPAPWPPEPRSQDVQSSVVLTELLGHPLHKRTLCCSSLWAARHGSIRSVYALQVVSRGSDAAVQCVTLPGVSAQAVVPADQ
jgi:hypothetical protein